MVLIGSAPVDLWSLGSDTGGLSNRLTFAFTMKTGVLAFGIRKGITKLSPIFQSLSKSNSTAFTAVHLYHDLSYRCSRSDHTLDGHTVSSLFLKQVEKFPDRKIAVFPKDNITLTYAQFKEKVENLAAGFLALGLQPGDRVGIWSPNSVEWVLTHIATAHVGLILVNINPAYRVDELKYALRNVGVKCLVMAEKFKTQNYYEMLFSICPELATAKPGELRSHVLPDLKSVLIAGNKMHPGVYLFDDVMDHMWSKELKYRAEEISRKLVFDQPINIQFTSGTTGSPKGATLTHHNIVNNARFIGYRMGYDKKETSICIPVPLYHCFGMVVGWMTTVTHGTTCVFPAGSFEPEATLKAIDSEKCTALYGTPTMFIDVINHPKLQSYDISSLQSAIMAGSPCPVEVMKQVNNTLDIPHACVAYGSTETSPVTFLSFPDDSIEKRCGSIGCLLDHTEAKIVNDAGEIVAIGESGELCTRGYSTMLSYWNNKEKTDSAISPSRWYHTGDLAVMDTDGYVMINGRIKDMIIRGGENIYPVEIEQFLYTHKSIEDVQVVGVPDKRLGEKVCAVIRIKPGQKITKEEVIQFCKGKISHFKIPEFVVFVNEYPLTVTGKVQKYIIREEMVKQLNLEHEAP